MIIKGQANDNIQHLYVCVPASDYQMEKSFCPLDLILAYLPVLQIDSANITQKFANTRQAV